MGAFERTIELMIEDVSPPEFQRLHAEIARQELAKALAERGDNPSVITIVDGVRGRSPDDVKPYGIIRFEFARWGDAIVELLDWLILNSPEKSGTFKDSFFIGVQGRMIAAEDVNPRSIPDTVEEVIVGNLQSYNRKIDVQMIGLQPMQFDVPPFLYERASRWFGRRFPDLRARRNYTITFPGQYILKRGKRAGKPVHSPGLIVTRR